MEFDIKKVQDWLKKNPLCPVCRSQQWTPLTDFVKLPLGEPEHEAMGTSWDVVYSVAYDCQGCGYRMLVAPSVMGIKTP